jgi:excisionase family DNA binding protein
MLERATLDAKIFTTHEVAKLLKISRRNVQWLIHQHQLKAVRIGRTYRVRPQHLEAFLAAHEITEPTHQPA